jgi:hypothetical protein
MAAARDVYEVSVGEDALRLVVVRLVGVDGRVVVVSAPADVPSSSGVAIREAASSKVLSLINLRKVGIPSTIGANTEIAIARRRV